MGRHKKVFIDFPERLKALEGERIALCRDIFDSSDAVGRILRLQSIRQEFEGLGRLYLRLEGDGSACDGIVEISMSGAIECTRAINSIKDKYCKDNVSAATLAFLK